MLKSSSVLNEAMQEYTDSVVLAICKDGTLASDESGKIFKLTEKALQSDAPSWKGGRISVNHSVVETGTIADSWYQPPYVMGRIEGLTPNTRAIMSSAAYLGVSQESDSVELGEIVQIRGHDVQEVSRIKGTGVSLMIYPHRPACPLTDGCGIPLSSEEPAVFNPVLNTEFSKTQSEPLGGPSMDDPNKVPTIDELTAKIATLEARNADLEGQIANHPKQMETALASHEVKVKQMIREENELNASVAALKSCMPDGFEEFMVTNPSKATIDATIKGLRSANPVGAPKGSQPTGANALYSSGEELYKKLGVTPEQLAKYNKEA